MTTNGVTNKSLKMPLQNVIQPIYNVVIRNYVANKTKWDEEQHDLCFKDVITCEIIGYCCKKVKKTFKQLEKN